MTSDRRNDHGSAHEPGTACVEPGDRVRLDYVGRFEDGTPFATSDNALAEKHDLLPDGTDATPLAFTVGRGEVVPGLDEAVVGMTVGEEATITVPPEAGYGEHDPDRVREYDPETFERMVGRPPTVGLHVEADNGLHGDVTGVSDTVQVDFNHEFAGRTLVFEITVLDIN
ncbi:MAG: peptidylprolyl isomerase [Haloarculaceae archaeon]